MIGNGFWWILAMCAGAIFLNGLVALVEDELPGGFNNPDGMFSPNPQVMKALSLARWIGVVVLLLLAFAISSAVIRGTFAVALGVGLAAAITLLAAALLWRSRLAIWWSGFALLAGMTVAAWRQ